MLKLRRGESGVAMVEFAVVVPLLALLLFGVLEASWAISKQADVRDATRQGARIAATSDLTSAGVADEICPGLGLSGAHLEVSKDPTGTDEFPGGLASILVEYTHSSLTGFLPMFDGVTISERLQFRVELAEEPAWWSSGGDGTCP